mgnify:CR=1 FL=1
MNNYPYNNQNNYQGYYGNLNQPKKKNKSRSRSPRNDYKVPSYNQNQGYPQQQYYQNPQNPQFANYGGQYNYSNYKNPQSYGYSQNYGYQGYNYDYIQMIVVEVRGSRRSRKIIMIWIRLVIIFRFIRGIIRAGILIIWGEICPGVQISPDFNLISLPMMLRCGIFHLDRVRFLDLCQVSCIF